MASAKMTLIGMNDYDNDLFHNLIFPDGIDKDLFIDTLILKAGEFEVLYPSPDFMKRAIGVWSNKWYRTFAEWLRGTQATWNPIHNYDRFEQIEDSTGKTYGATTTADYTAARTANLQDQRTANLTDAQTPATTETTTYNNVKDESSFTNYKETDTYNSVKDDHTFTNYNEKTTYNNVKDEHAQSVSGTLQHDVSAYDSGSYSPGYKDTTNAGTTSDTRSGSEDHERQGSYADTRTGNQTHEVEGTAANTKSGNQTVVMSGTDTTTHTGTDTMNHTGTDNTRMAGTISDVSGSDTTTYTHGAHIFGNIGVTQASDMLRSFYDISAWSLYDHMADIFTQELLIPVY